MTATGLGALKPRVKGFEELVRQHGENKKFSKSQMGTGCGSLKSVGLEIVLTVSEAIRWLHMDSVNPWAPSAQHNF